MLFIQMVQGGCYVIVNGESEVVGHIVKVGRKTWGVYKDGARWPSKETGSLGEAEAWVARRWAKKGQIQTSGRAKTSNNPDTYVIWNLLTFLGCMVVAAMFVV